MLPVLSVEEKATSGKSGRNRFHHPKDPTNDQPNLGKSEGTGSARGCEPLLVASSFPPLTRTSSACTLSPQGEAKREAEGAPHLRRSSDVEHPWENPPRTSSGSSQNVAGACAPNPFLNRLAPDKAMSKASRVFPLVL